MVADPRIPAYTNAFGVYTREDKGEKGLQYSPVCISLVSATYSSYMELHGGNVCKV